MQFISRKIATATRTNNRTNVAKKKKKSMYDKLDSYGKVKNRLLLWWKIIHKKLWQDSKYIVKNREKYIEKGKQYYGKNKERLQKLDHDRYRGLFEEGKRQENMQKVDIVICLKKTSKSRGNTKKSNLEYISIRVTTATRANNRTNVKKTVYDKMDNYEKIYNRLLCDGK